MQRTGCLIYLRRTNGLGHIDLLGHDFLVSDHWLHRLLRCEVDLSDDLIRVFGLRRQEPDQQRLLGEYSYRLPDKSANKAPDRH